MDSRPVFVLITAQTCSHCTLVFKPNIWPGLKEQLEADGKVQIVTIDLPTTSSKPDPTKYHKDLSRFIGWFPTMILFPASRWYNRNSELIGIVKNGKIVPPGTNSDGKFIPEHIEMVGKPDISKDDILKWVDYTIKEPMFTRKEPVNNYDSETKKTDKGNEKKEFANKLLDGKFVVPTNASYYRFRSGKVD